MAFLWEFMGAPGRADPNNPSKGGKNVWHVGRNRHKRGWKLDSGRAGQASWASRRVLAVTGRPWAKATSALPSLQAALGVLFRVWRVNRQILMLIGVVVMGGGAGTCFGCCLSKYPKRGSLYP